MALTKIPSNLITLDAIDGTLIADDAINSEHIANGAIDAAHMSANSIDSDSYVDGSIDTAHIGDDQVTAAKLANAINTSISDKLPLGGGTLTGNADFGNNLATRYGGSQQLQIYHNGTRGYITNTSGALWLQTSDFRVYKGDGSERMIQADDDGSVLLYYDGNSKLSTLTGGVNITGDTDTDTLTVSGTATVGGTLGVTGALTGTSATFTPSSGENFVITRDSGGPYIGASSNHSLRIITNNATRMHITSAGYVGIGVTPTHHFNLQGTGAVEARFRSTDGDMSLQISSDADETHNSELNFMSGTSGRGSIVYDHHTTAATQKMLFKTGDLGVTAMTITGDGNVGIGTTSPTRPLQIQLTEGAAGDFQTNLDIKRDWSSGSSTDRYTGFTISDYNSISAGIYANRSASHANYESDLNFYTNSGSSNIDPSVSLTKKMTILANGDFLMGNTVVNPASGFATQRGFGFDFDTGIVEIATTANAQVMVLGKNNANDGSLLGFRKQGTVVGSIGTTAGNLWVAGATNGIRLAGGTFNATNASGTVATDTVSLGYSNGRWTDLHLSGGVQSAGGSTFTSATPMSFNKAGSGTYNKTVLYDSQNDTANGVFSGLTLEMARLTDSGSATPRTFTISDRGASNRWCFSQYGLSFNPTNSVATAAESLDDYEEGTWSPAFDSQSAGTGTYTKIGRLVTVKGKVTCDANGAASGALAMSGLPFSQISDTMRVHLAMDNVNSSGTGSSVGAPFNAQAFLMHDQYVRTTSTGSNPYYQFNILKIGTVIYIEGSFYTTA
jgi:hypothetical protein